MGWIEADARGLLYPNCKKRLENISRPTGGS
jgi:hypothetical protein